MSEQEKYNDILKKFSRFPIPEDESTFLDLCHYSGERFEEICSRILEFFFQPNNKHGFGDLWFKSLCQLIGCECDDAFEMKTRTEEYTYGAKEKNKRIDIVLQTPSLIVAIENKIGADLYNNLDIYSEHIKSINGVELLVMAVKDKDINLLKSIADSLMNEMTNGFIFFINVKEDSSVNFIAKSNSFVNAGEIVKYASLNSDGNGGGSPKFAQGGGKTDSSIDSIVKHIEKVINNG